MSDQVSVEKRPRFRWWLYYLIPGLLLPPAVWGLVVLSRLPLSGTAPDAASLPNNVSLPAAYNNIPVSNVHWYFSDSFTGVFVVVGDADPDAISSWVEAIKRDGHVVTYGPIDSSTRIDVFTRNVDGSMPKYTGSIEARQHNEFFVGKNKVVIIARK